MDDGQIPPLHNLLLFNPQRERLHWNWVSVRSETSKIGFFCEHTSPIFVRLAPHQEFVLFAHRTHTALCLCTLSEIRALPGVQLQFQVPPPYSLFEAETVLPEFELYVLRRTRWEQGESPPAEEGWSRPPLVLSYNDRTVMVNHCRPECTSFV
jgi:hypothetical protein